MNWLIRKLFLVKEIKSRTGVVHFRRYRLLSTPWLRIYIHKICQSDQDKHMHDHPWSFFSFLLWGSYQEWSAFAPNWNSVKEQVFPAYSLVRHHRTDAHRIRLLTPHVWSFVVAWGKTYPWGYQTEHGWMDHERYREWKNADFPPV